MPVVTRSQRAKALNTGSVQGTIATSPPSPHPQECNTTSRYRKNGDIVYHDGINKIFVVGATVLTDEFIMNNVTDEMYKLTTAYKLFRPMSQFLKKIKEPAIRYSYLRPILYPIDDIIYYM